jgi:hypothetical protein
MIRTATITIAAMILGGTATARAETATRPAEPKTATRPVGTTASTRPAEAPVSMRFTDSDTGRPMPVRVRLRDPQGNDLVPEGAQVVPIGRRDRWFVSPGETRMTLPPGPVEVRVERGKEYEPVKQTIVVIALGKGNEFTFPMRRWVNLHQRGYVCGENHLHVPPDELGSQLAAEMLDFGTSLQWWNGPRYAVPPGEGFVRMLEFAGVATPTSVFDFEKEHAWGAVYVVGQPEPLTFDAEKGRPNLPLVKRAHEAGALVCYQGGWSPEVLLDALLGYVDVVNVCNNNFHRHQYQPRSDYSNLMGVSGVPVYADTPEGMMHMNTDTWYRLLNCGLKLAAGAGSATGAKKTPVGYNRAYVRAGENPTLSDFLKAWHEGRNFVTNGPMIFLTVNGRYRPGDTIELASTVNLNLQIEVLSDQPLRSVEVILNGETYVQLPRLRGKRSNWRASIQIQRPCWLAVRCTDEDQLLSDDELADYSYGSENRPRRPCRLRFAHTSPVYVNVGGRSVRVEESFDQARSMLDAFETFAESRVADAYRAELRSAIGEARKRLNR